MRNTPISLYSFVLALCAIGARDAAAETLLSTESIEENSQGARYATLRIPLEDVLNSLAHRLDVSFVFNSQLIEGVFIAPLDNEKAPDEALRDRLRTAELDLHEINDATFAITRRTTAQEEIVPQAPIFEQTSGLRHDTIVVTASAEAASQRAGARHFFVLDQQNLETLSVVNPADAIFDLPQSLASVTASTTTFLGATAGLNLADLRGFGPERTLVLINGRRRAMTSGGNGTITGFDLNSLGEPFLERIEIAPRSGGGQYGPEAVAGAINFVTRRIANGVTSGVRYGVSEMGDAQEFSAHLLGGLQFDNAAGELTLGINHTRQEGLLGRDRPITSSPYGFTLDGVTRSAPATNAIFAPGFGGSSIAQTGQVVGVINADEAFQFLTIDGSDAFLDGNGGVRPFTGSRDQLFNWLADTNTFIPLNRTLGLVDATYALSAKTTLFWETNIGYSESRTRLAPIPSAFFQGVDPIIGDAALVPITNDNIPPPVLDLVGDVNAQALVITRRFSEVGPRRRNTDRLNFETIVGADQTVGDASSLQAYFRFSRNAATTEQLGRIDRNRLLTSLDSNQCPLVAECTTIDLFRSGGLSDQAADYITASAAIRKLRLQEQELAASLTTPIDKSDKERGSFTAGFSLRRTSLRDIDQSNTGSPTIGSFSDIDFSGSVSIAEGYATVDYALFDNTATVGGLNFSGNVRITASSQSSTAENVGAALTWRPLDSLSIFGGFDDGERQPNVTELFVVGRETERFFIDPCENPSSQAAANCALDSPLAVDPGFSQSRFLASQAVYGNPNLDNERTRGYRFGTTIQPTQIFGAIPGDINLTATWLSYRIGNIVSGAEDALSNCFNSVNFTDAACGDNPLTGQPLLQRDPSSQQIISIDTQLTNGGARSWRGLDLEARYIFEPLNWGALDRFWFNGLHTYTHRTTATDPNGIVTDETGLADFPKHQSLIIAGLDFENLQLSGLMRRRGRVQSVRTDIAQASAPVVNTFDATVRYSFQDSATIFLTVENLTDREAPLIAFANGNNTFPQFYDIIGRRFSFGLKTSF